MAGQTVLVSVLADTNRFKRSMSGLAEQSGLSKLGAVAGKVGRGIGLGLAGVAAGAVVVAKQAATAASSLEQSVGAVSSVFKDQAGKVGQYAAAASGAMGLSKNSYNELAAIIGTTLKASGTPLDQLADKTNGLMGISADLAATFGGPVTDAAGAMGSALRGEFEPLRRYGVSLSANAIAARAMADTGKTAAGELTAQEKALATQALILEQTADAQGAFARESGTLAGVTERLKAKWENISATLGTYLLPALVAVAGWVSANLEPAFQRLVAFTQDQLIPAVRELAEWFSANILPKLQELAGYVTGTVVPALQSFGDWLAGPGVAGLRDFGQWVADNADWLKALAVVVGVLVVGIGGYIRVMALWRAATAVATAVQAVFNTVMAANPIGLVILAIAALVAGLVYFFTQTETGQAIVAAAWSGIQDAITAVTDWWTNTALPAITGTWDAITAAFQTGKDAVARFLQGALDVIVRVWSWSPLGLIVTNWDNIMAFFAGIPAKVRTQVDRAIAVVAQVWSYSPLGLIVTNWDNIMAFLGGIPGKVRDAFVNAGTWLADAGRQIIAGLLDGITSRFAAVRDTLTNLTDLLPEWKGPRQRDRTILRGAGRLIVGGLVDGLRDRFGAVQATLAGLTDTVAGTTFTSPTLEATPVVAGGQLGGVTIQVYALADGPDVGRRVHEALESYYRVNGRR